MRFLRRNLIFFVIVIFIITFFSGCGNSYKSINQDEALQMMKSNENLLIVDVRTQEEYDKRHIPNAVLVPINDLKTGKFDALPDKNQILLIYCWTGRRAQDAATILADNGYTSVYEFGGLVDWTGETEGEEIK